MERTDNALCVLMSMTWCDLHLIVCDMQKGDEKDFFKFTVASEGSRVIPGVSEAVIGMSVGGIRRVIVPVEKGYTAGMGKTSGQVYDEPAPNTFSGRRSLDFVLRNQGYAEKYSHTLSLL